MRIIQTKYLTNSAVCNLFVAQFFQELLAVFPYGALHGHAVRASLADSSALREQLAASEGRRAVGVHGVLLERPYREQLRPNNRRLDILFLKVPRVLLFIRR